MRQSQVIAHADRRWRRAPAAGIGSLVRRARRRLLLGGITLVDRARGLATGMMKLSPQAFDAIELAGFTLAILDFAGWSHALERSLDRLRVWLVPVVHAIFKDLGLGAVLVGFPIMFGGLFLVWRDLCRGTMWSNAQWYAGEIVHRLTDVSLSFAYVFKVAITMIELLLLLFFGLIFLVLSLGLPPFLFLLPLAFVGVLLHVLNMPKRGIVGSIALLTAIGSMVGKYATAGPVCG